jgi:hypothetical protein
MPLASSVRAVPGALAMIDRPQKHQHDGQSDEDAENADSRMSGNDQFQHDFLSEALR